MVILHPGREVLLCHVTGQRHWDLPKGGIDRGETPREAALRETREETGLVLAAEALADLGRCRYTLKKDLHLFAICVPRFELGALHCATRFLDRASGRWLPEMNGYGWFAFERIEAMCATRLGRLLRHELDLDAWLARLPRLAEPPELQPPAC